jgi:hypothetical protein
VVEDVPGDNLEALLRQDPRSVETTMARLAEALGAMQRHRGPRFGKVALIDKGGTSEGSSCEQVVLDRALGDLAEAAARDTRITRSRDRLESVVRKLAAAVRPRSEYGLIHGELGPDHVLVDRHGQPVLIDIEGLMFFDVEWEHAFLRLRFGLHYRWLDRGDLDQRRLRFYMLAMRLSLVAGHCGSSAATSPTATSCWASPSTTFERRSPSCPRTSADLAAAGGRRYVIAITWERSGQSSQLAILRMYKTIIFLRFRTIDVAT